MIPIPYFLLEMYPYCNYEKHYKAGRKLGDDNTNTSSKTKLSLVIYTKDIS